MGRYTGAAEVEHLSRRASPASTSAARRTRHAESRTDFCTASGRASWQSRVNDRPLILSEATDSCFGSLSTPSVWQSERTDDGQLSRKILAFSCRCVYLIGNDADVFTPGGIK